ncbi:MAG TPA: hypothetical protein VGR35_01230 [Tepidisphaeraceae bacterium]|nr:hypothetical protein [Tepidisphaeraceae bacterium]
MKPIAPPNPLAQLCRQMGLPASFMAERLKLDPALVAAALELHPSDPGLATYVKLLHQLDARMRVDPAAPPTVWINNGAIYKLVRDNHWRAEVALCAMPRTTKGIVEVLRILRDRGMTQAQIARYMRTNFIPSGWGRLQWDEAMVSRKLSARKPPADRGVRFSRDDWRKAFRRHVVSLLLVRIFPADPAAALRYGYEVTTEGERTILRGKERMPACVRDWTLESLGSIKWFAPGEWGIGDATPTPAAI